MDAALAPLDKLHLLQHRRGVAIDRFSSEMHAGSVFPAGAPCLPDWKLICVLDAVRSPRLTFRTEMHAGSVFPAGAPCLLDWKLICVLDAVRSPRLTF